MPEVKNLEELKEKEQEIEREGESVQIFHCQRIVGSDNYATAEEMVGVHFRRALVKPPVFEASAGNNTHSGTGAPKTIHCKMQGADLKSARDAIRRYDKLLHLLCAKNTMEVLFFCAVPAGECMP